MDLGQVNSDPSLKYTHFKFVCMDIMVDSV